MWLPYKNQLLNFYFTINSYKKKKLWKGNQRIFCISLQKTGTTSVGDFFEYFGYPVVRSDLAQRRKWNQYWFYGKFNKIFNDPVFKNNQVFEDAPFWAKDFYKVLYDKFPNATFILLTRDSDQWFESLVNHGNGKILGNKHFHAHNYNIPKAIEHNFNIRSHKNHYTNFYELRNEEIIDFFKSKKATFFHETLESSEKWNNLANLLNLNIRKDFDFHSNAKR